jgi:hypothetical protein
MALLFTPRMTSTGQISCLLYSTSVTWLMERPRAESTL